MKKPNFKVAHYPMLNQYRFEREHADFGNRPMRPFATFQLSKEEIEQDRAIVESFMREIKQAAVERRPLPLRESEDMSPLERLTFRRRLSQAITEGGVIIVTEADQN